MNWANTSAILDLRAWVDALFVLGRLEECPMRAPLFHSAFSQVTDSAAGNVGKPQVLTLLFAHFSLALTLCTLHLFLS
jgi:hypothetical protein